jgi:hypothetical protein
LRHPKPIVTGIVLTGQYPNGALRSRVDRLAAAL